MFRLVLGLLKGAVIGGGVGYGAWYLGLDGGWNWIVYGLVGFLVGFLVGRPFWSHIMDKSSTIWTPVMKGIFGFGIGCGLYALATKVISPPTVTLMGQTDVVTNFGFLFGGAVGGLFGAWVEVDDAPAKGDDADKKPAPPAKK